MAKLWGVKTRKAAALDFLKNTKGLVELIVLNIGISKEVRSYVCTRTEFNVKIIQLLGHHGYKGMKLQGFYLLQHQALKNKQL